MCGELWLLAVESAAAALDAARRSELGARSQLVAASGERVWHGQGAEVSVLHARAADLLLCETATGDDAVLVPGSSAWTALHNAPQCVVARGQKRGVCVAG